MHCKQADFATLNELSNLTIFLWSNAYMVLQGSCQLLRVQAAIRQIHAFVTKRVLLRIRAFVAKRVSLQIRAFLGLSGADFYANI